MSSPKVELQKPNENFHKYYTSIFLVGKRELLRAFGWLYKGGTQHVGEYLQTLKGGMKRLFAKEKKLLEDKAKPSKFDISFTFKLLQRVCGLADEKSPKWRSPKEDEKECLEHAIFSLKEKRNAISHEPETFMYMTDEELQQVVGEVCDLCRRILKKAGEIAGKQVDEVDRLLSMLEDDRKNILESGYTPQDAEKEENSKKRLLPEGRSFMTQILPQTKRLRVDDDYDDTDDDLYDYESYYDDDDDDDLFDDYKEYDSEDDNHDDDSEDNHIVNDSEIEDDIQDNNYDYDHDSEDSEDEHIVNGSEIEDDIQDNNYDYDHDSEDSEDEHIVNGSEIQDDIQDNNYDYDHDSEDSEDDHTLNENDTEHDVEDIKDNYDSEDSKDDYTVNENDTEHDIQDNSNEYDHDSEDNKNDYDDNSVDNSDFHHDSDAAHCSDNDPDNFADNDGSYSDDSDKDNGDVHNHNETSDENEENDIGDNYFDDDDDYDETDSD